MKVWSEDGVRRTVALVAALNVAYFCLEFTIALVIGSVSLFADSIDFLEDTSLNCLIFVALRWSDRWRARVGMALSGILLAPSIATLWMAWHKFVLPAPPEALALSLTGIGASGVNFTCALVLARYRHHSGSLMKAAFLSARNDVLANLAIVAAGLVTAYTLSWPDLVVGLAIAAINADAARKVWSAARQEHLAAEA